MYNFSTTNRWITADINGAQGMYPTDFCNPLAFLQYHLAYCITLPKCSLTEKSAGLQTFTLDCCGHVNFLKTVFQMNGWSALVFGFWLAKMLFRLSIFYLCFWLKQWKKTKERGTIMLFGSWGQWTSGYFYELWWKACLTEEGTTTSLRNCFNNIGQYGDAVTLRS